MSAPLLTVENLVVDFSSRHGTVRAVDEVDLQIARGETLALVGESGCGKSTLGRAIARLLPARSGSIRLDGSELLRLRGKELRRARRQVQIVFQDPAAALNSRMSVGDLVEEPLLVHRMGQRQMRRRRVDEILTLVGLGARAASFFPHQFSGGQRQRIAIARALALEPDLLIADEPTSSLDVSIQAQILLLLKELQGRLGLAMLFISHDLAVVRALSDRVAVMYLGKLVEVAPRRELYEQARHPYTRALLRAAPRVGTRDEFAPLPGEIPSALQPPSGCRFRTRCPIAIDRCADEAPWLRAVGASMVACHRAEEVESAEAAVEQVGATA